MPTTKFAKPLDTAVDPEIPARTLGKVMSPKYELEEPAVPVLDPAGPYTRKF